MKRISIFTLVFIQFLICSAYAYTTSDLAGTFKLIQQSAGFSLSSYFNPDTNETEMKTSSMVNGYVATWSFDGQGNCSVTDNSGTEYDMSPGFIDKRPGSTGTQSCTYAVASNGTITINIAGFNLTAWLNADGTTFIWGGGGWDNNSVAGGATPVADGGPVWTEQAIAVKQGASMSKASLNGTFKLIQQSAGFSLSSYFNPVTNETENVTGSMVNGYVATWSFDGQGNCSVTDNGGTEYDMGSGFIDKYPGSTGTQSCTYTVASNGTITINIAGFNLTAWLNADGTTFIWGGGGWDNNSVAGGATPVADGGPVWTEQAIAVKQGASMSKASLNGTFKLIQQSAGFTLSSYFNPVTNETENVTGSMVNGYVATWSFDGQGNCSVTDNSGTEYDMSPGFIDKRPGSTGTQSCTYAVASNGTITINIEGFNLTAWLNADGTTFIWGGGGWDNNSVAGGATPVADGGPVWTEQAIAVKTAAISVTPVTTASPAGGTYSSAQNVTLTANKPATIYYTTNGTTPSISSPVYSGPVPIPFTTTLKFFARDTEGSNEPVKTESYTVIPINGACGAANGTTATSVPTTNLCAAGTPSTVIGNGPWSWNCAGINGGTTASCSAQMQFWSLTALFAGTGVGSVNGDITCVSGSACPPAAFRHGTTVTMIPTPNAVSTFGGWSGACTGTGNCILIMSADKTVTANFTGNPATVKIDGVATPYYSIDLTLDLITTGTKAVYAQDNVFLENVIMTSSAAILLKGGYIDNGLTTRGTSSYTVIDGSLKIRSGTLRVERVKVL